MSESQRNAVVVVAIALVVFLLFDHGGGDAVVWVRRIFSLAFAVLIGWWGWKLYHDRSGTISLMDAKWRTLLQVSAVAGYVVYLTGTLYPAWSTWSGGFALLWFLALAACIVGIYYAWQQRTWHW